MKESKVLILGLTFKENCPDIRNTKVLQLIQGLKNYKVKCDVVDPFVNKEEVNKKYKLSIKNEIEKDKKYSVIIVAVAHNLFKKFKLHEWQNLCLKESLIFDLKGIVPKVLRPKRP